MSNRETVVLWNIETDAWQANTRVAVLRDLLERFSDNGVETIGSDDLRHLDTVITEAVEDLGHVRAGVDSLRSILYPDE